MTKNCCLHATSVIPLAPFIFDKVGLCHAPEEGIRKCAKMKLLVMYGINFIIVISARPTIEHDQSVW